MSYVEALSELIDRNTQDYVDELGDIKNAIEMLNERAADNTREKINSLYKKIFDWDNSDSANDLVSWLNELRDLDDDFDVVECDFPKALNYTFVWQRDLYRRLDSILTIYSCTEGGDIVFQDKDGKFYYEHIDALAQKCLGLKDKREVAHQLIEKMSDEQLNEVIITKLYEVD
jgi:hypothetical protein